MKRFTNEEIKSFITKPLFDEKIILKKDTSYPKISIVTPSYNQAKFLEYTILSVLNQNYPNLEYIIIDGGSTDGSVDIIKKYEKYISYWVSEKDRGQTHALNKGFAIATGDLIGWQNSDDIYLPDAFDRVIKVYKKNQDYGIYFGNMYLIDENNLLIRDIRYTPFCYNCLIYEGWNITNQAVFFKNSIFKKYKLDESYHYAMDGYLFTKIGLNKEKLQFIREFLGCLRIQPDAKGSTMSEIAKKEWNNLRKQLNIKFDENKDFSKQHILKKFLCIIRRTFFYFIQGDWDYIIRGIIKRGFKK